MRPASFERSAWPGTTTLPGFGTWFNEARRLAPWLWWCALAMAAASLATSAMMLLDARTFNGVSVWVKPWKFQVSLAVHLFTLALFAVPLAHALGFRQSLKTMSFVAVAAGVFEVVYITWRASRGEASHFNGEDAFASIMYALMGLGAVALTACAGWLGWRILRQQDLTLSPLVRQSLGWGLVLGFVLGTLSGAYVSSKTGHWVGGTLSDAVSVPVVGWSLDGGDLRVAHFFGLHAMQVLPLAAWAMGRTMPKVMVMPSWWMFCVLYVGWTAFTFWQATQGLPLISRLH